jgi:hypothetical protein
MPNIDWNGSATFSVGVNDLVEVDVGGGYLVKYQNGAESHTFSGTRSFGPFTQSGTVTLTSVYGPFSYALSNVGTAFQAANANDLSASTGSSLVGFVQSGTGAVARTVQDKQRDVVSVKDFGAVGDGATDDTAAIQAAHAASRNVYYPAGTYKIHLTQGQYLFKGTSGRYRFTGEEAMILDTTTYTKDGAFTQIFWVDATDALAVHGINYTGPAIPTPSVNHGYIGSSFIRATSGAKNISVDAYIENARHGIHSGDYTSFSLGECDGFKAKLRTKFVGYPVALYLAHNLDIDILAESTHRAAYLAGCKGGRVHAYFKDQYIAPIQVLMTDATTNGLDYPNGASRGCSDLDIKSHDIGSTTWIDGSFCAGIAQSRGDAGTVYQNISVDVFVKSDDATASTLSSFAIYNNYIGSAPSYPNNWTNPPIYRNIKLTGTLDRSAQTIQENNSNGEIYVYLVDDSSGNAAVMQGFSVKDFIYAPGSGAKPKGFWFSMPAATGPIKFDNCNFDTATPFLFRTNATCPSLFNNTTLRGSAFGTSDSPYNSAITFVGCIIGNQAYQPFTNKRFINTPVQGAGASIGYLMTELTLSGASVTWANALPNQAIILGVSGYVTQAITGATGYTVGTGASASRFVTTNTTTLGSSFSVSNGSDTSPQVQVGTGDIVVAAKTSNFTGGKLRLFVSYIAVSSPTS